MTRYAESTSVSVENSRAEIERAARNKALCDAYDAVNACGGAYSAAEKLTRYADGHGEALDDAMEAIRKLMRTSQ